MHHTKQKKWEENWTDFFWEEIEERSIKQKTILPLYDIDFPSGSDSDDGVNSSGSHSPYIRR